MTSVTEIEIFNLSSLAIRLINCPSTIYSAEQAADHLSSVSGEYITPATFIAFRQRYLEDNPEDGIDVNSLPVKIGPDIHDPMSLPRSVEELTAFAHVNTLGVRNGVVNQAMRQYVRADEAEQTADALKALKLMVDTTDSIDKKVTAISGNDPAAAILMSEAFTNFKTYLADISREHPEWGLMEKLKDKMAKAANIEEGGEGRFHA